MPSIPVTSAPSVNPGGTPLVRAPQAAFGVPQAVDLSGVQQMVQQQIQQANQVAVSDADAQIVRAKTARLWDPKSGAMQARGKDAIGAQESATSGFQEDAAKIEASLSNDTQKEAFRRRVDMHYQDLGGQLGQHVATQIKQYDTDTTSSHLDALTDSAVASYSDERGVQRSIDDTRAVMTDFWKRNGHGEGNGVDEFAQRHIADRISAIRSAVLAQLIDPGTPASVDQAEAYFTTHRGEFTGKQLVAAEKMIRAGAKEAAETRMADQILGLNQSTPQPPKSYAQAVAEAEAIQDGGQRKEVLSQIDAHYQRIERGEQRARVDAVERLSQRLEQSGGKLNKASADFQLLVGHPEMEHLLHRQEQIIHPPKDPGNPDAFLHYSSLNGLNAAATKEFLSLNVVDLAKKEGLSFSEASRLISMQRVARGQDIRGDEIEARRATARAAEAEQLRYQRENALLKAAEIPDKAERDTEVSRIKRHFNQLQEAHGITAPAPVAPAPASTGPVDLGAPTSSPALAGILTPKNPVPAAWQERVLADPKYRTFLDSAGYDVGSVRSTSTPPAPAPAPEPAPAAAPAPQQSPAKTPFASMFAPSESPLAAVMAPTPSTTATAPVAPLISQSNPPKHPPMPADNPRTPAPRDPAVLPAPPSAKPPAPTVLKTAAKVDASPEVAALLKRVTPLLGIPYQWGGTSKQTGYDCSAFVREVFGKEGIVLPRTTGEQIKLGTKVDFKSVQPGDLLFFDADKGDGVVDHVALYAGNNQVAHASSSGGGVRYDDLSSERGKNLISHLLMARRIPLPAPKQKA